MLSSNILLGAIGLLAMVVSGDVTVTVTVTECGASATSSPPEVYTSVPAIESSAAPVIVSSVVSNTEVPGYSAAVTETPAAPSATGIVVDTSVASVPAATSAVSVETSVASSSASVVASTATSVTAAESTTASGTLAPATSTAPAATGGAVMNNGGLGGLALAGLAAGFIALT